MWLIITLLILGAILLVAELVLLPGLSVAGIGALISYGVAIYLGFENYGTNGGLIVIGAVVVLSVAMIAISMRARTWRKLALHSEIDGVSQERPEEHVKIGAKGQTVTRLAPMGKVTVDGKTYEAKSLGDKFLDPDKDVEVVGYENFNIVVKPL
jgi:membrane-bound ClpP family serine protease